MEPSLQRVEDRPRYYSFDFIRALAILGVLFVHRVHYSWNLWELGEYMRGGGIETILVVIVIVLFTLAGIFYLVSGTVNVLALTSRLSSHPEKSKQNFNHYYRMGLILILLNYIHRIFFANGFLPPNPSNEPEFAVGLLTGLIKYGHTVPFYPKMVTEPGTLFILGLAIIVNTFVIQILGKKQGSEKFSSSSSFQRIFLILSAFFLLIYPLVKLVLMPLYDNLYTSHQFIWAYFVGHLSSEFSPFPYLGFSLYGGFIAFILKDTLEFKTKLKKIRRYSLPWLILGLIFLVVFDRETNLGERFMAAGINYVFIFLFSIGINLTLRIFDFNTKENMYRPKKKAMHFFELWAHQSLTLYFFEALIASILIKIINIIFSGEWQNSIYLVLLFAFFSIGIWYLILSGWRKASFKGSFEWVRAKV